MSGEQERYKHTVRMMNQVSFRVEFVLYADRAFITEPVGWIADEVALTEGTYDEIRTEAHRLVDVAVDTERCSKYANRGAGAELKRNITLARKYTRSAPRSAAPG